VLTQLAETTRDPEIAKTLLRIASEHTVCADEAERTLALARTTNKDHQQSAFDPEDIERLSRAYEDALRTLELPDRSDPITQIIALRIIEAAKTGVRDPVKLCDLAVKDLRVP
jgi:hypothetical protein